MFSQKTQRYLFLKTVATLLVSVLTGCGGSGGNSSPTDIGSPVTSTSTSPPPTTPSTGGGNNGGGNPSSEFTSADITLSWLIPNSRADGSALPLGDIAGYEISYANSVNETTIISLSSAQTTSYLINDLAPDDYQFVVFAYDTSNAISDPSPIASIRQSDFPTL